MASGAARSSRSRPAGHSGVLPAGTAAAGVVGGGAGMQHADKLKILSCSFPGLVKRSYMDIVAIVSIYSFTVKYIYYL